MYGHGDLVVVSHCMVPLENGNGSALSCKEVEVSLERSGSSFGAWAMAL